MELRHCIGVAVLRPLRPQRRALTPSHVPSIAIRSIATHTFNHHAQALSVLPSKIDKSSAEFKENAKQMGEVMASMQELHRKIESGGPAKAREKHIARGKMLPREYVSVHSVDLADGLDAQSNHRPTRSR